MVQQQLLLEQRAGEAPSSGRPADSAHVVPVVLPASLPHWPLRTELLSGCWSGPSAARSVLVRLTVLARLRVEAVLASRGVGVVQPLAQLPLLLALEW